MLCCCAGAMERRVRQRVEGAGEGQAGGVAAAVDAPQIPSGRTTAHVDAPEIPSAQLVFAEELGRGSFGRVRAATAWAFGYVAVKEPLNTASRRRCASFARRRRARAA